MTVLKNIKNLASDSMIYGLAGIATRVMGVVLTPLYTRVYSPEDYGVFGLVNNAYSLIALVLVSVYCLQFRRIHTIHSSPSFFIACFCGHCGRYQSIKI